MLNMVEVTNNIERHLKELSQFTATPDSGITRLPFSKEGRQAAEYLKEEMMAAGMKTHIDCVGNVRGRLEGEDQNAQTIMIGSHYDSVKNGGKFDGIAGVVCGIEVARCLNELGINRKYAIEVVAFNDEEGMMFGSGCLGSKTLLGMIDEQYITHLTDENGISIKEWLRLWGSNPKDISKLEIDRQQIRAFFEIHIEQGPILDVSKEELGIVDCIVGLLRCMVTVKGRADHAGTTPMDMRRDALSIASKVIGKLDDFAQEEQNGSVATSGFIRAYPNAMNVIAKQVEFTIDLRSKEDKSIDNMEKKIKAILQEWCEKSGATYDIDIKLRQHPVYLSTSIRNMLVENCKKNHYSYREMVSGAAHDAMIFADKIESAMVFVPSREGRSHCPEEFSKYHHLAQAVKVVYETIVKMNREER